MKYIFLLTIFILNVTVNGQSIIGKWVTYDNETNEKKGVVEIYKKNNSYFAKIVKNLDGDKNAVCEECERAKKNKPIIGLVIIENLKKDGSVYEGGTILDPETGESYNCRLELVNTNKLKVRGYLGFSIFGRTQYWLRAG